MEHEYRLEHPRGEFPPPLQVLNAAITKIQEDGTVLIFDDELNEYVVLEPYEPVDLEALPTDTYAEKLLWTARSVHRAVKQIAGKPEETEQELERLALALTPYRHEPHFLREAASMVKIDEDGLLHFPRLSLSDWEWDPRSEQQWTLLEVALRQIQPDLPHDNWSEVQTEVENRVGPNAAEVFASFVDMTNDELDFLRTLASKILEGRDH